MAVIGGARRTRFARAAAALLLASVAGPAPLQAQDAPPEGAAGESAAESAAAPAADPVEGAWSAILQGLDKTTARVSTIVAPVDGLTSFGSLEISARACRKRPPTEPPESTAFLEIVDRRPDAEPVTVFSGWMFASSPAVSAMEHPVYDVWVIDCAVAVPGERGRDLTATAEPETGVLDEPLDDPDAPVDSEAAPAD
ncbi:MAG TPA: DUF2155 domain-containing protein [Kiloniellales bacterium]|nr:DUF2155 domain-containing protein [Kiloniellales bacterium]